MEQNRKEERFMETKIIEAELIGKHKERPSVMRFIFRPEEEFDYEAGQFGFFTFEKDGTEYSKHFSFSNAPTRENLDMTTILSGSDYKNALDSLETGTKIKIKGPFGKFTLSAANREKLCFLTGGIGITPIRSMLEYAVDREKDLNGYLFYSNRDEKRIAFREELEEMASKMHHFKIIHTLTDLSDEEKKEWEGETGFIDAQMIKKHCPDYKDRTFYIVGPPAFNKAMREMVTTELELEKEQIVMENFTGY
jgi:ferredoxin-NADP reductase